MKLYFHKTHTNLKEYTVRLIEKVLHKYMTEDFNEADAVMVSLCDVDELKEIAKAKQYGKPVIAGGMISEFPIVNELADYTWHGEIYGFKECLDKGIDFNEMLSMTSKYGNRKLVVDQMIVWRENPIVKVGGSAMYYYVSKGCPVKCKYCFMSYVREYQVVPQRLYKQAMRTCGKRLMPIAAYNPYNVPDSARIGEVLLKKYVYEKKKINAKLIRSGIEFVIPENSKKLAKGVSIDHVNEALAKSKCENTKMILYFIIGLERQEAIEEFFNKISMDYAIKPQVYVIFTYINPQPFTPMHDFDLRNMITNIDLEKTRQIATMRNKRIRMYPFANASKSIIRTLMGRAVSNNDYQLIRVVSKKSTVEILERCEKEKPYLLGGATMWDIYERPRERMMPEYWSREDK